MQLKLDRLAEDLQKRLLSVYLLFGDEQFLMEEASDLIRQQARKLGTNDRRVWHVDNSFKWSEFQWQQQTISLFADKKLLEIRLPSGSPGREGGEALRRYAANPPADATLIIISGKIDARSRTSKWFIDLDTIGATIAFWSVDRAALPRWILQRSDQLGLRFNQAAATLLAERIEGNLPAAAQEIDRLKLLCPSGDVDEQMVLDAVADNTRFQSFDLIHTAFNGHTGKIPRMIIRLRAEVSIEQVLAAVSWSLHRIVDMAMQLNEGKSISRIFAVQKIWKRDESMFSSVLRRHNKQQWWAYLDDMARIDQAAKGSLKICPWMLLERLCIQIAQ